MTRRDRMRESVTPFLRAGETVQVVFSAMARNPLTAALAEEFRGGRDHYRWRIVAVTHERILVLEADPSGRTAARVRVELSRSSRLGPPSGLLMHVIPVEGEKLRVIRHYWKDIKAADSMMNVGS